MENFDEYYKAIDEITDSIKTDLFGPTSEKEIFEDIEPYSNYVTGILYPQQSSQNISANLTFDDDELVGNEEYNNNDDLEITDNLEEIDDTINSANKFKPSSMGISVMVPSETNNIEIMFECGVYEHITETVSDEQGKEIISHKYVRKPQKFIFNLPVAKTLNMQAQQCNAHVSSNVDIPVEINLVIRKIMDDGSRLITVSVINKIKEKNKRYERNEYCLFQCKLTLTSSEAFLPVYQNEYSNVDIESQITELLYSSVKNYAYGHGCSVYYDESLNEIHKIESNFIPKELVYQMLPGKISEENILYLNNWKNADRNDYCDKLNLFIAEYENWKNKEQNSINNNDSFFKVKTELINRMEICILRLRNGVEQLRNNDCAWNSFILMNEAMLLQRINTKADKPENIKWYPFQLAYILQIIPDIINPESPYRNYVDLLWFPTGGGKTEAYLGVSAFTIFYRRLSNNPDNDGVTIIMRYTLRLLTIQQFERASALICACEYLRRKNNIPGGEISIGLWIGSSMTPNHIDEAEDALNKIKENKDVKIYEHNPIQITQCPWCGKNIDVTGYKVINGHLHINCEDENCEFHKSLPIYVVDDDIYNFKPTLLLSTIDKFARIAWVEESKNLFGVGSLPPSLIIQDELHLISGALGSLAGLYEIAVDYLCSENNVSPKVIASTATVKNANSQIKNLYGKEMIQFPPNGLSYEDSFFAHIANKNERPARTYLGVCESGGTINDLMIRIYSILTFMKIRLKKEGFDNKVIDQFYTTVGYFNAIRDLGTSSTILQDRMYTHIKTLIIHNFKDLCQKLNITIKDIPSLINEELTSRKSSKEIKDILENLNTQYPKPGCYSSILASNMLSVGIDIYRLGLMTVYDQPKTNSEYIQATSRVGRQNPGLVIAMYNPRRSRDKSHYEQFGFYHRTFYKYVEATSVTPFSSRAMEKALHCVFVAMVRLSIPEFGANDCARHFDSDNSEVKNIKNYIINRISQINPRSKDYAEKLLSEIISSWDEMTNIYPDLSYVSNDKDAVQLLNSAENNNDFEFPPILNSLRNVEESSNVYINR